jgi:hypothetical protein
VLVACCGSIVCAQAEDRFPPGDPRNDRDERPRNIQEGLAKLRIEKDKKKFNEMLRRGEDVAKLAAGLQNASPAERADKVAEIGKLVKKIRDDLGGDGDGTNDESGISTGPADVVKLLQEAVNGLTEELKKADRFTVSAAAIESSNNIIRLVRTFRG